MVHPSMAATSNFKTQGELVGQAGIQNRKRSTSQLNQRYSRSSVSFSPSVSCKRLSMPMLA